MFIMCILNVKEKPKIRLYMEREREAKGERQAPTDPMTRAEIKRWTLNRLRHPDTPSTENYMKYKIQG